MDLNTITMDPDEAAARLIGYKLLPKPDAEEKAILGGLMALAAGKQIVNLRDAIEAGGTFEETNWPRLAAMRADQRWCYLSASNRTEWAGENKPHRVVGRQIEFRGWDGYRSNPPLSQLFEFTFDGPDPVKYSSGSHRSQVPIVPPNLRPTWRGRHMQLRGFVVLWEVEEWAKAPHPPGDPALLRHLAGDLYTVEAVWDLTELERAVLGARTGP